MNTSYVDKFLERRACRFFFYIHFDAQKQATAPLQNRLRIDTAKVQPVYFYRRMGSIVSAE